jgi:hypothetical protein
MPRIETWNQSVPRVELDQRSREARLRLEQIERLILRRAAVRQSRLRRALYLFRVSIHRAAPEKRRARGPLSDRRPSRCSTSIAPIVSAVGFSKFGAFRLVRFVARPRMGIRMQAGPFRPTIGLTSAAPDPMRRIRNAPSAAIPIIGRQGYKQTAWSCSRL